MARRFKFKSRANRPLIFAGSIVAIALLTLLVYAMLPAGKQEQIAQANPPKMMVDVPVKNAPKLAAVRTESPATQPIKFTTPTTPATKPAAMDLSGTSPTPLPPAPVAPVTPVAPRIANSNVNTNALIEEADAKKRSEDYLGARKLLVDALDSKKLSPAEQDDVFRRLSEINEVLVFSPRKFLDDPYAVAYTVKSGELMTKIAQQNDITWKFLGRLNGISDPKRLQAGKTLKIVKGPFHAVVNKTNLTLDIYMGKPAEPGAIFVKRFRVGLGENDSTPTGLWNVDIKLENPRYYNPRAEGPRVIEPDDPKNPLGERWIALIGASGQAVGKTSYGIHGTIDPASIGQRKSMGCIRMLNEDVELVYDMLTTGKSTVTVSE